MRKSITFRIFFSLVLCTMANILVGQNQMPIGLTNSTLPALSSTKVTTIAYEEVQKRDDINNWQDRVSVPADVNLSLSQGEWSTLDNEDRLWRMQLTCKNAKGMALMLKNVSLPVGATMQLYSADGKHILNSFSQTDVNPKGNMMVGPAIGSKVILEYFEPKNVEGQGNFDLFRIQRLYKDYLPLTNSTKERAFGDAWECQVNVNCDTSGDFDDVERSVARILMTMEEGLVFCTGALMNNTAQDMTPYLLTAFHCASEFTPLYEFYRFDFNFTSSFCTNPAQEPPYQSLLGCVQIAGYADSDFELLRLFQSIPTSFNAYFAGWNRVQNYTPDTTTMIHHPSGDVKKITQDYDPIIVFNSTIDWDNGLVTTPRSHYRGFPDSGAFQGGSSGCPYLDNNGHIIGQLHGGDALCDEPKAFSGRLTNSWVGGGTADSRMRDWLDPINSGALIQDGLDPSNITASSATITGRVVDINGDPMSTTVVFLTTDDAYPINTNSILAIANTDDDGNYAFEGVATGQNYYISSTNDRCRREGLSVSDVTRILSHLLFQNRFSSPYQYLVADVNNDGDISVFDALLIRALLLGTIDEFPNQDSYLILRSDMVFEEEDPFESDWQRGAMLFQVSSLSGPALVPDFVAYKIGDPTLSSNGCDE